MIIQANALQIPLAAKSVQTCVTSPPYWGLRDYGIDGQLGLEPTPEQYVANMVAVFAEVWRVLRDDGTVWLNLGDSYSRAPEKGGSGPGNKNNCHIDDARRIMSESKGSSDGKVGRGDRAALRNASAGLKPKDLVGVPWRVAFALQAAGWYLRSDIIWAKPNPMPESVTDRPTKSHEYIFLLSKRERYYYDAEAVKEPSTGWHDSEFHTGKTGEHQLGRSQKVRSPAGWKLGAGSHGSIHENGREQEITYVEDTFAKRNIRTVWTVATQPYSEAHFATFPEALIKPCILAGAPVGGMVLDPFAGSGTTVQVSQDLGRRGVGLELNPAYSGMGARRSAQQGLGI